MSNKKSSGIRFSSLLLLTFIILKLCNVITWSWWWVFAPLWIPCILLVVLSAIYGLVSLWEDSLKEKKSGSFQGNTWEERMSEMKARQKNG